MRPKNGMSQGRRVSAGQLIAALLEQVAWRPRLGLLDLRGATAAVGGITVVAYVPEEVLVVVRFDLQGDGSPAAAPRRPRSLADC